MLAVLLLTAAALLAARALRAPRGTWRYIVGAAAAALAGSQLLPEGAGFRTDVAASARALFWIGLALAPVAAYAVVVGALRRRAGTAAAFAPAAHPRGLVRFEDDVALAAETAAALAVDAAAALPGRRLSLGWRGEGGRLEGHLRLRVDGAAAEVEMLRVEAAGVASALIAAAEAEAARLGARSLGALVGDWERPEAFAARGFRAGAGVGLAGGARRWMEKPL